MGFFPLMMEHLPASSLSAVAASEALVDEADIYIGIYAHRYGHQDPERRMSYAEIEYNRAVERGIPRFIFLADKSHSFPPEHYETGDGALKLRAFIRRLKNEQILTPPFKSPDDLRAHLVHSLGRWLCVQVSGERNAAAQLRLDGEVYPWKILPGDSEQRNAFLAPLADCNSLLTVHAAMDSYLLPDPIALKVKQLEDRHLGLSRRIWRDRMEGFKSFARIRREARKNGDHAHVIVGSPSAIVEGIGSGRDLYEHVSDALHAFRKRTVPCFVAPSRWRSFAENVSEILGLPGCKKLNVSDGRMAVAFCRDFVLYQDHPPTVERIRSGVETVTRAFIHGSRDIVQREPTEADAKAATAQASEYLRTLCRRRKGE
jgi:hypothetical protein